MRKEVDKLAEEIYLCPDCAPRVSGGADLCQEHQTKVEELARQLSETKQEAKNVRN